MEEKKRWKRRLAYRDLNEEQRAYMERVETRKPIEEMTPEERESWRAEYYRLFGAPEREATPEERADLERQLAEMKARDEERYRMPTDPEGIASVERLRSYGMGLNQAIAYCNSIRKMLSEEQ